MSGGVSRGQTELETDFRQVEVEVGCWVGGCRLSE